MVNVHDIGRSTLLTLSCLLVAGCSDPNRAKLVGTWTIIEPGRVTKRLDVGVETPPSAANDPSAEHDDPAESTMPPKMLIQFLRNGQITTITQMGTVNPNPKLGSWELVAFDEPTSKMKIKCKIGLQESEHEIEFLDEDTIKLVPPNLAGLSLKLKFQRQ